MLLANGLRKVDMQDLLVFLQVHQRQNFVEVAEHLNLSPSTVIYCLKKLRQAFDAELFIATRGGMQPTHKSRAMLPHVEEMLARINACHAAQGSFDPRGEPRTFTLCAPEYVELLILPALLRRLAANGPRIGLDIRRLGPELPTEALLGDPGVYHQEARPERHVLPPDRKALARVSDEIRYGIRRHPVFDHPGQPAPFGQPPRDPAT
ncbi:LysR family transcriptional regulator, partial [Burkholderia multivorans]|uniref:LysR family transcriptional regulator n=1 Tax=Burkholderia multivorans TaxID=87883 RepID=UPI001C65D4CB